MVAIKYCENCGITHTSLMCFSKPRQPLTKRKTETYQKELETKHAWFKQNPGPVYECYLQISDQCPKLLNRQTVIQEHVIPRSRGMDYKYAVDNIRPACFYCNSIKGSQTLEALLEKYPHLTSLVKDTV